MMGSQSPHENAMTIGLLVVLIPAFVLGVFLPNARDASDLQILIAAQKDSALKIPERIAHLNRIREQIEQEQHTLKENLVSVPAMLADEQILGELQAAARASEVNVMTISPAGRFSSETASRAVFRLEIAGSFRSVSDFLTRINQAPRAYRIDDLNIERCEAGETGYEAYGYITLSVFSCRHDFNDSAGNADRVEMPPADRQTEGPQGPDWLVSALTELHR